jgi:hypothetical protein
LSLPRTFSPLKNPYRKPARLTFAVAAAAAGIGVLTGIGVAAPAGGPAGLALAAATTQHVRVAGPLQIPDHAAGAPSSASRAGNGASHLSLLADGLAAANGSAARHGSAGPAAVPQHAARQAAAGQAAGQATATHQTASHQAAAHQAAAHQKAAGHQKAAAHKSAAGQHDGRKSAGGHHGGKNGSHGHHRHHHGHCHSSQLHWWICHAELVMRKNGTPASKLDTGAAFIVVGHESGGDPGAYNGWDSNAAAGTPSEGIAQVIQPTFKAYHLRGFGDIWNPVDNMIAAFRYAIDRYGSMSNIPGVAAVRGGGSYMGY